MFKVPPLWREGLAGLELAKLLRSDAWRMPRSDQGAGRAVLLIPGFLAGDGTLKVLGAFLRRRGFHVAYAGITSNIDCSEAELGRLERKVRQLAREHGPVAIVGHSRGGLLARVLAVRLPDQVAAIVTLGSPHRSRLTGLHPVLTCGIETLAALQRAGVRNLIGDSCRPDASDSCCARYWQDMSAAPRSTVRFVSLYSRTDGVLDWRECLDEQAQCVAVRSTHCGMAVNEQVFKVLVDVLTSLPARRRPATKAGPQTLAA